MPPRKDLTGQVFGRLTVISPNLVKKYYWDCLCSCGNKSVVAGSSLVSGGTKACGCLQSRFKDLSGKVFGRLSVLRLSHIKKAAYWHCQCVCGNQKVVAAAKLSNGETRSCGCLHKELTSAASRKDLAGKVFGRLTVLEYHHTDGKVAYWDCQCECGNRTVVRGVCLRRGDTRSCGCFLSDASSIRNSTHGLTKHPLYSIWGGMKQRCYDVNCESHQNYGGRGIIVCAEWLEFLPFYEWALSNGFKKGLSIERKENNGNYCPENCKWATKIEQNNNTRRNLQVLYHGELLSFVPLVGGDSTSARYMKVWRRIYRCGWDVDRAVDTP